MRTCMQQDDALLGHRLDIFKHALKVEANRVFIVISVLLDIQARVLEDGNVVAPSRCR